MRQQGSQKAILEIYKQEQFCILQNSQYKDNSRVSLQFNSSEEKT